MGSSNRLVGVLCVLWVSLSSVAWAGEDPGTGEAAEQFESLYGRDLQRVAATRDVRDDVALAAQFVEAAKTPGTDVALITVLCEKAYALASKNSAGFPIAVGAMDAAAFYVPAGKEAYLDRVVSVRRRQYEGARRRDARSLAATLLVAAMLEVADVRAEAGDLEGAVELCHKAKQFTNAGGGEAKARLRDKMNEFTAREKVAKQVKDLASRLEADPADAATRRELIHVCLVEMDDPAEAAKYLDDGIDPQTRKYIPAAARSIDEAPEMACLELGDWYRGLADEETGDAAKAMLNRALDYYRRFFRLHRVDDAARSKVRLAIEKVDEALAEVDRSPGGRAPAGWINLLKVVNPTRDAEKGKWFMRDGTLVLDDPGELWCKLYLPLAVQGSYRLRADIVCDGAWGFWIHFPAGPARCSWGCGTENNYPSHLSINSKRAAADPGLGNRKGHKYNVEITVSGHGAVAAVTAAVQGRPPLRWEGLVAALQRAEDEKPHYDICLQSGRAKLTFTALQLQVTFGKVVPYRRPKTSG